MISCLPIIVLLLNEINVSDRYIVKASRTRRPFGQIVVSAKSRSDYFVLKCELIMVYRNICKERFDSIPELARATEVVWSRVLPFFTSWAVGSSGAAGCF